MKFQELLVGNQENHDFPLVLHYVSMIEVFFSILFLLVSYFMTTLALVQGYIPGTSKTILEKDGKVRQVLQYGKIMLISFLIASVFSSLMFYYFVYPLYYPL